MKPSGGSRGNSNRGSERKTGGARPRGWRGVNRAREQARLRRDRGVLGTGPNASRTDERRGRQHKPDQRLICRRPTHPERPSPSASGTASFEDDRPMNELFRRAVIAVASSRAKLTAKKERSWSVLQESAATCPHIDDSADYSQKDDDFDYANCRGKMVIARGENCRNTELMRREGLRAVAETSRTQLPGSCVSACLQSTGTLGDGGDAKRCDGGDST